MIGPSKFRSTKVSVGDIANLAGVGPSAVSNWRTRHADFPSPIEKAAGGDLFDRDAIDAWLVAHDRFPIAEIGSKEQLHAFVGTKLRESGQLIDHSVLIILQALYLCMITSELDEPNALSGLAEQLSTSSDPIRTWEAALGHVATSDELTKALEVPSGTDPWDVAAAFQFSLQLSKEFPRFGELATSVLRHYEDWQGSRGSDAMTNEQLTKLIGKLLAPIVGAIYDPAAGSSMVLAEAWRARKTDDVRLFGQEVSEFNWKLGYLHLALYKATFELLTGDTLLEDKFRSTSMDRIAVEPPFGGERIRSYQYRDERWRFSPMPKSPEWLWAQHLVFHLADDGVGVVVASPASLFRSGDSAVRIAFAESGCLDAVIDLPQGMGMTSAGLALLVFDKSRANRADKVLFVNARQLGKPRRGQSHELTDADLDQIQGLLSSWRAGKFHASPLLSGSADVEEIRVNKGDLSPQRYVRYSAPASLAQQAAVTAQVHETISHLHSSVSRAEASLRILTDATKLFSFDPISIREVVKLGAVLISQPRSGVIQNLAEDGDPIPYVKTSLVSGGNGHLDEAPDDITYRAPESRRAKRGDLLLVSRGLEQSTGGCSIVDFDGEVGYAQSLVRLSVDLTKVDPDFLRLYLTSGAGRQALAAATTGSVIGNLRVEALQQLEIRLPPLETQRIIAAAVVRLEQNTKVVQAIADSSMDVIDALRDGIAMGTVSPATREPVGHSDQGQ